MPPFRKLILPQNSSCFDSEQRPLQIEPRQPVGLKQPLIGHVVNGEHRRDPAEQRMRGEKRLQIDRRQPRLPVMRMHDRWSRATADRKLQRRADQDGKPSRVVRVIADLGGVEVIAIVQASVRRRAARGPVRAAPRTCRCRRSLRQFSGRTDRSAPRRGSRDTAGRRA